MRKAMADARRLDNYGVDYVVLTGRQLRELEPHISETIVGAIHFRGSPTSSDPGLKPFEIFRLPKRSSAACCSGQR